MQQVSLHRIYNPHLGRTLEKERLFIAFQYHKFPLDILLDYIVSTIFLQNYLTF